MDVSLGGKVAIITGAGAGIGLATARLFLESGAGGVVAVERRADSAAALADACPAEARDRLAVVVGDVATEGPSREAVAAALGRFGRLDIVINNAGVSVVKPLHEHTPEEWDRVMDINVKAIYWMARHAIPALIAGGGGSFLSTGSISGVAGIKGQGAYAASKGAVHQMTRQMAIEYAPHRIRVNAVCPGTVDTPLLRDTAAALPDPAGFLHGLASGHPIGRIATAEEIAATYLFLASDHGSFYTGATILIDGGFTA